MNKKSKISRTRPKLSEEQEWTPADASELKQRISEPWLPKPLLVPQPKENDCTERMIQTTHMFIIHGFCCSTC